MTSDEPTADPTNKIHYSLRQAELDSFAKLFALKGLEAGSKRVINVWGERDVGKSTFISSFRESQVMQKSKVLWIQPTRDEEIDTIPEFIQACAKTARYPAEPDKEKKISEKLETVQRGKVNQIVSDDSMLIMRSSVAKNRKLYINEAASSSVGRTENVRDDVQINMGLGESKANNHAEAFLDALPLQSLGTDLTVLYIEDLERLSISIQDWLRDYVIPSATRGAYRRNVVIILESSDPLQIEQPNFSWGEWDKTLTEFRLYPMSEDDVYQYAAHSNLDTEAAHYVFRRSQGYPRAATNAIKHFQDKTFSNASNPLATQILEKLNPEERAKLGGLCLPNELHADELDALFGAKQGKAALQWLADLPTSSAEKPKAGKLLILPNTFRYTVVTAVNDLPEFKIYKLKWAALARLTHNAPSRAARSKLLLLAGLNWIDESLCSQLFGNQAEKVTTFLTDKNTFFNRNGDRYHISERFRNELQQVARGMGHIGVGSVRKKAEALWDTRRKEIEATIESIESQIGKLDTDTDELSRKQAEAATQLRMLERDTTVPQAPPQAPQGRSKEPLFILLILLAITIGASSLYLPPIYNTVAQVLAVMAFGTSLTHIPNLLAARRAKEFEEAAQIADSPEYVRKQNSDTTHDVHVAEFKSDDLKRELESTKKLLEYSYV